MLALEVVLASQQCWLWVGMAGATSGQHYLGPTLLRTNSTLEPPHICLYMYVLCRCACLNTCPNTCPHTCMCTVLPTCMVMHMPTHMVILCMCLCKHVCSLLIIKLQMSKHRYTSELVSSHRVLRCPACRLGLCREASAARRV